MKQSFVFYILSLMIVFSNSIAKDRKIEALTGPFITDSTYTSPQTLNMINPLQGEFKHIQQQGQSWSNDQIGINTGKYISTSGSAVTCLAMLYKAKGVNVDPGKLNTWLIENNGYADGGLLKWDVAANYSESKIVWYGSSNYNLAILKSEIDAGNPVIANVMADGEQFIVVKRYSGNGTSVADYIVADPMNLDESNLSEYTVLGLRIYRSQVAGIAATLTVTNPIPGTTWEWNTNPIVKWDYSGFSGNISIDIYQENENKLRIEPSVPVSDRQKMIQLPTSIAPGKRYRIGISAVPTGDPWSFSGYFDIRKLNFTYPTEKEIFTAGQVVNIKWIYENIENGQMVAVDLYKGGINQLRFNEKFPFQNGSANVTIPSTFVPGSDYYFGISTHEGLSWDFSNTFTIVSPPPSTIYLNTNFLTSNCAQGTNASTQSFQVRNSGSGTLSYSINSNASWMYCSPSSGTSTGEYDNINVNYNTSGLGVGTYNGTITVSGSGATNNPQTINVSLVVTSAPRPAVSVTSLSNSCVFGTNATNQSFEVWNSGGGTLFYAISDNATSWLSCAPTGGTSTGERDYIAVNYSTSGLSVGTYNASIMVNGNGITETISVVLNVTQNPTISFNPASINITCKQDGFLFPTPLDIWNSGGGILSYTLNTNVSWLSFRLTSETLSGDHSDNSVFYNPEGLSVGTHNATITISAPGATNTPQTIPVTLIITPKPQISLNPANLNNSCAVGNIATSQSFEIWNSGGHTLEYNISTDVYWLSCLPPSGSSTGEHDIIQVNYFSSNLTPGTYNATITIGGNFDDVMIPVSLTVTQGATISRNPITLTNGSPLGSDAPSQNFEVWNSGNSTLTYTISDNVSWLSCTPTNGTSTGEHDNVTVNYSTAGLSAGTYNATITINASGATNSPQTIPVTLTVSQSPIISLNTTSLKDSCLIGQNAPAQSFEVWNSGGGILSYTISDNVNWLSCSPISGTSSGEHDNININYSTTGLSAGMYNATITISASGTTNSPQSITVYLKVLQNPNIAVNPISINNSCVRGSNASTQNFEVWNSGGGIVSYTISDNVNWLSCSTTSGTSMGEHDNITINYATTDLLDGTYNATITVSASGVSNSPQTIAVTLTVSGNSRIALNPTALSNSCALGTDASRQTFQIWNPGGGILSYSISDNVNWLTCAPTIGTAKDERDEIDVNYNTSGLSIGTYQAKIMISASDATNSPQTINVTLNVSQNTLIAFNPQSLIFSCSQGGTTPDQTFQIWNSGSGELVYTISDNANWLTCSTSTGSSKGEHDSISVACNTSGLSAGTYNTLITISADGVTNSPQTIPVTLTVTKLSLLASIPDFLFCNNQPFILNLDSCLLSAGPNAQQFMWTITPSITKLKCTIFENHAIFYTDNWTGSCQISIKVTGDNGIQDSLQVQATVTAENLENKLRLASYCLQNFPENEAQTKLPYLRQIFRTMNPNLLVIQEIHSQAGVDLILNSVLNEIFPGRYAAAPFLDVSNNEHALFFDQSQFELILQQVIPTAFQGIGEFVLTHKQDKNLPEFRIYSVHFEEGDTPVAEQNRYQQARVLRKVLNLLPLNHAHVVCGNLNVLDGNGEAFQKIISNNGSNEGHSLDPANSVGKWANNPEFAAYHTNSTRKIEGNSGNNGLSARFDFILLSQSLLNVTDYCYADSSFTIMGNDGRHFNAAINDGINWNVTPLLSKALYKVSDHLPVYLNLSLNATNKPPRITSADSATAKTTELFKYIASAIDPAGDPVTITFRHYPHWLMPQDSIIAGTPSRNAQDTSFVVEASDGELKTSLKVYIKVIKTNSPPYFTSASQVSASDNKDFSYTARAVDPEDDIISYIFTNYPNWLAVNDSIISGKVPVGTKDFDFHVIASDGELSDTLEVVVKVISSNLPPQITSADSVVAYEDSLFTYSAEARDPENKTVQITFTNYPSWLKPDKNKISGTPKDNDCDTTFMVLATDGIAADSQTVFIKFLSVNDQPRIVDLTDITIGESEIYYISLNQHVTDEDHLPSMMTWQVNSLNPKLLIEQNQNLVSIQGTSEVDTTTVQFKVTDPGGLYDVKNVKVTILHTSGVANDKNGVPGTFTLEQNYPNPFNPETSIRVGLPKELFISVKVYDVQGRVISELLSGKKSAGYHQVIWQAHDVPTGLYLIKMEGDGVLLTRKCLLVK